jgi:hypothetical protein
MEKKNLKGSIANRTPMQGLLKINRFFTQVLSLRRKECGVPYSCDIFSVPKALASQGP